MKKHLLFIHLFIVVILSSQIASSQNPLVKQWDYRYGGLEYDNLFSLQVTTDGGYILGGYSISGIGGDKTQDTIGSYDYWIVKLNSSGLKEWDKNFGGTSADYFHVVKQTSDGGYILGGTSDSGPGGDKTQGTWSNSFDFWIVKTDSLGNKLWDKTFGGTVTEYLNSIDQTSDGGYILGGHSNSGISGDKTQSTKGLSDYWIVKIDSAGTKQWDKDFGGSSQDELYAIEQTRDGGYIFGGYSSSGISGDKSQASWGNADYWIVKTDSLGIKQWDKDLGGNSTDYLYSLQQTTDRGFILGGISISGISGDKTQPTWGGLTNYDFWIIKTDSLGIKQWDKDLGGADSEDEFGNIMQTWDGGYVMGGNSYSNIGGDKTENNLGQEQTWVVKVDALGNKQWDKTLLTDGHDESGYAVQTHDGCYAMANLTFGGVAGNKTQPVWGHTDYWIIKFCDTTQSQNPVAGFTSPNHICPGTCTDITNLSFNATSFEWILPGGTPSLSTDANPNVCYNTPGNYSITLIATNAMTSDTLTLNNYITVYPFPPPQGILQNGDTLFAIAGGVTYQWFLNGNPINGATSYFFIATQSGNYNVVVADANGCEVEAVINNVIASLTPALSKGEGVTAFPNPVEGTITIDGKMFEGATTDISVYNIVGEKIFHGEYGFTSTNNCQLDCSMLPPGSYILEVTSDARILRTKFMKK